MKEILSEAYLILRIALVIGILNFIFISIFRKSEKKYLILMITSFVILLIFATVYFLDTYIYSARILPKVYYYFIGAASIFFIVFTILFFVHLRTFKFRRSVKVKEVKKKMIYTYHEKKEILYYFYTFNDSLFLNRYTYKGESVKLKKSEFADEVMDRILKDNKIDGISTPIRKGILTIKQEKDDVVYYCYMIELKATIDTFRIGADLTSMSKLDYVNNVENSTDKYIIIKSLSSYDFDETIQ